ncbi:hypothetical protein GDO86_017445 [Hymenochirus boettgeri]|uniref:Uncharacterized protein n=1 Tax=Hymenochirus boettgeri TaxID=247094 RepID=A0A8T2INI6_9PIPI|nr:hypothetical protein GDO86_017445 [Hymenochirus boettgeri]
MLNHRQITVIAMFGCGHSNDNKTTLSQQQNSPNNHYSLNMLEKTLPILAKWNFVVVNNTNKLKAFPAFSKYKYLPNLLAHYKMR